jgi:hypothetical protein
MGIKVVSTGVEPLCCETDPTPPGVEFMNAWSYTFTLSCTFMAWCLIRHRENCTFYFVVYIVYMKQAL